MKKIIRLLIISLFLISIYLHLPATAFETNKGQTRWPKFALKLNAGLTRINGGDLNLMIQETNELAGVLDKPGAIATSNFKKIKSLPNLQAEIFYFPLKNFALSLAVDTFYARNRRGWLQYSASGLKLEAEDFFITYDSEFLETADLNLRNYGYSIKLYYFINLRQNLQLYVKGGPSLHYSKLQLTTYLDELEIDSRFINTGIPGESLYHSSEIYQIQKTFNDQARKWYAGFQGGFGLQLNLSPRQSLVLEADFRLARASNLKSQGRHLIRYKYESDLDWTVSSLTVQGNLSYLTAGHLDQKGLNILTTADPQLGQPGQTASINISGLVLKAGFRFKL